jgi:Lar family restriction alleviation protein
MPEACPFCGSDSIRDRGPYDDEQGEWFYMDCKDCAATGPCRDTVQKAILAWNTRAAPRDKKPHSWTRVLRDDAENP